MFALLARGSIWDAYCLVVSTDFASEFSRTYCNSLKIQTELSAVQVQRFDECRAHQLKQYNCNILSMWQAECIPTSCSTFCRCNAY